MAPDSPPFTDVELANPVLANPVVKFLQAQIGLEPESLGVRVIGDCLNDLARDFVDLSFSAIALGAARDPQMFARVVAYFAVNESWLFRNPVQFAELRRFAHSAARPLRVLSLPCACGEEPTSIAITLHEAGLAPNDFSILAGDLDADALAKARSGRFPLSAFRGNTPDPRWFERADQQYIFSPSLFARIDYRQCNVLEPDLFRNENFDVIFCRNLMIYLHGDARTQVLQMLRRLAAPGALVFTGTAEPTLAFEPEVKRHPLALPTARIAAAPAKRAETIKVPRSESYSKNVSLPYPQAGISAAAFSPTTNASEGFKTRLAVIEQSANDGDVHGLDKTAMPVVYTDSALMLAVNADSTSSGVPELEFVIANG